tara:strand:+ start:633 stop:1469 length:837 start_codon:yes stop_codon:yes gene_type:complete
MSYSTTLNTSKPSVSKMLDKGHLVSISILPIFSKENDSYNEYFRIINYIDNISNHTNIFKRNKISIKIQQLSLNKQLQWKYLHNIIHYAQRKNVFFWISAITMETLDIEYEYYLKLLSLGYKNIGITLAAYNTSVSKKIDHILSLKGHVRLVKGIYKGDIRNSKTIDIMYYKNAIKLIDSGYYHTIATHDFKMIRKLYSYNDTFYKYIELAFFYNSYNYVQHMLPKMPFKTDFISFYIPHGEHYSFLKDNIILYSLDNIMYIIESKFNGFKYDLLQYI